MENTKYEELYMQGQFSSMLNLARQNGGQEAAFWELTALLNLGELDEAMKYSKQYEAIFKDDYWKGRYLTKIGAMYQAIGDYDKAQIYYGRGDDIFVQLGIVDPSTFLQIYRRYADQGDMEALEAEDVRKLHKKSIEAGNLHHTALSKLAMSQMHLISRNTEAALSCFLYADRIAGALENITLQAYTTYRIIEARTYSEDIHIFETWELEKRLKRMNQQEHSKQVQLYLDISQALVFKMRSRFKEKAKAEPLLRKIIDGEIIDYTIQILATKHLIDLLLAELSIDNSAELLKEIVKLTDSLENTAQEEGNYRLLTEIRVLKAKLYRIGGNFNEAEKLLRKSLEQISQKGLVLQIEMVNEEIVKNKNDFQKLKEAVARNAKYSEMMMLTSIEEFMDTTLREVTRY